MTFTRFAGALALAGTVAVVALTAAATPSIAPGLSGWSKRVKLHGTRPQRPAAPSGTAALGDPLNDLSAEELATFVAGLEEFTAIETPEGGLGPIFNDSSCVACHAAGGIGGASDRTVTRFGRVDQGRFSALDHLGGSLLQAQAIDPAVQEHIPAQANVVAQRVATPLFGAGLIEAIADDEIEQGALRNRRDGISGRANRVLDVASGRLRVGRFGWKAQHATLLSFSGDAYLNEMGVTSRLFPYENAPNGRADLLAAFDKVPDVEDSIDPATGKSDIDHAADFMRFLAPPAPLRATAASLAGSRLFEQTGCAACHTPVMFTARNPVRALSHQPVRLYSDLLLHDMGSLGDGIEQDGAGMREMRTAPLWGLRARARLLHDGRATTVKDAIAAHDGEAQRSRQRFERLNRVEQQNLIEFLAKL